jgi:acyl-coenzyme A thioesterase PaaI-like protein
MTDRRSNFPGTRFLSRPAPAGFGMEFYVRDDKSIYAEIIFDESKEGGSGILHGGAIAAVLDEAMGVAAYEAGHAGYTVTLTCNYKKHIPLGKRITIRARVDTIEGRRVFASCEALLPDGEIAVDATGIFIRSETLQRRIDERIASQD